MEVRSPEGGVGVRVRVESLGCRIYVGFRVWGCGMQGLELTPAQ